MPDLKITPLSMADPRAMAILMDGEVDAWISELGWDYSPVRNILSSFIAQNLLPGFAVVKDKSALGYAYFLMYQTKGVIGTVYAPAGPHQTQVADELLGRVLRILKESPRMNRVEAQIMPFHNLNLEGGFTRNGFRSYARYFLELDLLQYSVQECRTDSHSIVTWSPELLAGAAEVAFNSYRSEADASICEDYCSLEGCNSYLRSLCENPGCGSILPQASFVGMNPPGRPCGFIITSRISPSGGMIPQIAIHPASQGQGLGNVLMLRALDYLKNAGYLTVGLTVTKNNRRAFEWYQRLGFRIRKEFSAYVWTRE